MNENYEMKNDNNDDHTLMILLFELFVCLFKILRFFYTNLISLTKLLYEAIPFPPPFTTGSS